MLFVTIVLSAVIAALTYGNWSTILTALADVVFVFSSGFGFLGVGISALAAILVAMGIFA
ncbi:MAG: hypothetical protein ACXV3U_08045 [Halobacteriota archaeon]